MNPEPGPSVPAAALLAGRWQPVRAEFAGEPAPAEILERMELEFTATDYAVRFGGEISDAGTYELAPGGAVGGVAVDALVLHGTVGTNVGRRVPCICRVVGERLRVCFGFDGRVPTEFATAPGAQRYLATYRRLG